MQAQDLIKRVAEYDESLARDLQKFIGSRKLGLVYEESKPEYVRLWNKPVVEGDLVNVLPPRGIPENLSDDADEHDVIWRVAQINGNKARLLKVENGDLRDASLDDLVAVARFDQNIYCGLRETGRVERGGDKPYQVVINGENFHALESLLFAYKGKVDCIYIDPPYNTGAKDWKYNNNYVGQDDRYRHSKWLTFMEDRLRVAKQLLNPENSVLICTIDEKEYLRLGLLLENIFSSDDFTIQMVSDVINPAGVSRKGEFSRTNEFIYVVMRGNSAPNKLPLDDAWLGNIRSRSRNKLTWDNLRRRGTNARRVDRPNLFYPIYLNSAGTKIVDLGPSLSISESRQSIEAPDGCQIVWPLFANGDEGNWQLSQGSLRPLIEKGYVKLGRPSRGGRAIRYLKAGERKKVESGLFPIIGRNPDGSIQVDDADYKARYVPGTSWLIPSHDSTQHGSRLLRSVIPNHKFPFPKSLYAVEDVIRFFVADKPNALIVDFFAGSGTTTHAVMRLNHQDGGRRRSVCITNNEVSADEQETLVAKGLRQGDADWERLGICEYVTKPRVTAVITGMTPTGKPIEGDYKFTDEFPMADGFKENAVFYDLTYLEPAVVSADLAFEEIAPLLWMRAGSVGQAIHHGASFDFTKTYGVLFDTAFSAPFIRECRNRSVRHVFVVTDIDAEWRAICRELPEVDVVQLYKHYLRSFEIGAGR